MMNEKRPTSAGNSVSMNRKKKQGIRDLIPYLKHTVFGCCMAVASFSTALAVQPTVDGEGRAGIQSHMNAEITEEDADILRPYLDGDILSTLSGTPYEVIIQYIELVPCSESMFDDYFGYGWRSSPEVTGTNIQ